MRFFILLFGLTILTNTLAEGQGVSMSPTRLFFTGNPGETVTKNVILSNSSENVYTLSISYKDWNRDEEGNKVYYEPGTLDKSNVSWVSTVEKTFEISPESTTEIEVQMEIPENASDSTVTNSMMFFTQLPRQSDKASVQGGIGIITLFEFGLHIYYTPPGNLIKSLEITKMESTVDNAKSHRYVDVGIFNDGNVVNDATVEFELTNTDTGEEIKLDPKPISIMPEASQLVRFTVPDKISGNHLGVTIIKMAGTNDMRVGEKTFRF